MPSDFYWQGDNLFRGRPEYYPKGTKCELNFSHAVNVVQQYAMKWPKEEVSRWTMPEEFVPYRSAMDFLWTMRTASAEGNFFRMSNSLSYNKALATALNALPPGCALSIRNEMDPPAWAAR